MEAEWQGGRTKGRELMGGVSPERNFEVGRPGWPPQPAPSARSSAVEQVSVKGKTVTMAASSEASLTPAQRAALPKGAIAVKGQRGVHAETKIMNAAQRQGGTVERMGTAPRNPCGASQQNCEGMLNTNGVSHDRPLNR